MKVIQPFFLGGACGLALALAIAIGIYASPLRKALYLEADVEIAGLRERMDRIQERMDAQEIAIAQAQARETMATGKRVSDSLKSAQAGARKEYRHWRNRMADLVQAHDRATPAGFLSWAYSLRYWILPSAALMSLLPALLLAFRGARKPRPFRSGRPASRPLSAQAEALSSFESAVKKVARIAEPERDTTAPERKPAGRQASADQETKYLLEVPGRESGVSSPSGPYPLPPGGADAGEVSPYETASGNVFRDPGTDEFPLPDTGSADTRPAGAETQVLDFGPGWGETHRPPAEGLSPVSRPESSPGLSMEDEDGAELKDLEDPPSGTLMPPTTEVEKVERRKAEVLKLARKGLTSSEISRRMRISQDQVEFIIRMRREKG